MFRRDISPYSFFLSKEKRRSDDNKHERHSKMRNIRRSVPSHGLAKKESRQAGNDIADQIGFQNSKISLRSSAWFSAFSARHLLRL